MKDDFRISPPASVSARYSSVLAVQTDPLPSDIMSWRPWLMEMGFVFGRFHFPPAFIGVNCILAMQMQTAAPVCLLETEKLQILVTIAAGEVGKYPNNLHNSMRDCLFFYLYILLPKNKKSVFSCGPLCFYSSTYLCTFCI